MISIITVYYNNTFFIDRYFKALSKIKKISFELIFICNYHSEEANQFVKKYIEKLPIALRKKILIKYNKKNFGFAKAVNVASKYSKYDNLLLLNPDSYIEEESLSRLIAAQSHYHNSVIGGRYVDYKNNDKLQYSGVANCKFINCIFEFTFLKKICTLLNINNNFWISNAKKINVVDGVSGGYMLMPKKLFYRLNKFDENYFLYLEDLDFCLNCKKNNIDVIYVANAVLNHFGGGSFIEESYRSDQAAWFDSRFYFFKKNFPKSNFYCFCTINFIEKIFLKLKNFIFL